MKKYSSMSALGLAVLTSATLVGTGCNSTASTSSANETNAAVVAKTNNSVPAKQTVDSPIQGTWVNIMKSGGKQVITFTEGKFEFILSGEKEKKLEADYTVSSVENGTFNINTTNHVSSDKSMTEQEVAGMKLYLAEIIVNLKSTDTISFYSATDDAADAIEFKKE